MLCDGVFKDVIFVLTLFSSLFLACHASTLHTRSPSIIKDSHPVPKGWHATSKAPADALISLRIGLKHSRFDELERRLYEVSNPHHVNYGLHLSAAEVDELARPTQETNELVHEWLLAHGIDDITYSSARDWLMFDISVSLAEVLLDTVYQVYEHAAFEDPIYRTETWSLPLHLHEHIDAIHPTNNFPFAKKAAKQLSKRTAMPPTGLGEHGVPSWEEFQAFDWTSRTHVKIPGIEDVPEQFSISNVCTEGVVSSLCLRKMYGTLDYKPQNPDKVSMAMVNYLDQVVDRSDTELFLKIFRPDAVGAASSIKTEIVANGMEWKLPITPEQVEEGVAQEGNLDAQIMLGVANPVSLTTYNVGGLGPYRPSLATLHNTNEPYLEWLQYMLSQPELPQIISTSYADEEQTIPYWYAKRACQGFAQLGARGVSLLFASGDHGIGPDGTCYSNEDPSKPMFLPNFPASCPYVTTVGGTRDHSPEIVAFDARTGFVAGGGFSNYFPRPHYQESVVTSYLSDLGSQYHGLYNATGRAYPDISASSYHYMMVWNGTKKITDGTSASTPAVAAIFALVNDALAAEGKPPLGWLNPWIYSHGFQGFKDILVGSIPGCDTSGFPATKGWDVASGFGTPWFPALRQLASERRFSATVPWYMPGQKLIW